MPKIAPTHGTIAEFKGEEYPLLIRHQEIERWEQKHSTGILKYVFSVFGQGGETSTSRQDKDFIILGLTGAGMDESKAAALIDSLPITSYVNEIVVAARDLVLRTFYDIEVNIDQDGEDEAEDEGEAADEKKNMKSRG